MGQGGGWQRMGQPELEVAALCEGATTLTRDGNRIASLALLSSAVGIAPANLRAHRRLAAALANSGDLRGAGEEFVRYVEVLLRRGEYRQAALELAYARASLGDDPALLPIARELVPLGAVARTLALAVGEVRATPPAITATPDAGRSVTTERTPLLGLPLGVARRATAVLIAVLASITLGNLFGLVALAAH